VRTLPPRTFPDRPPQQQGDNMRTVAIIALALVIGGCSDPAGVDPEIADLVGTWMPEIVSLGAPPSLTFTADREFISRSSGLEVRGRYSVEDGVLSFEGTPPPGMYA